MESADNLRYYRQILMSFFWTVGCLSGNKPLDFGADLHHDTDLGNFNEFYQCCTDRFTSENFTRSAASVEAEICALQMILFCPIYLAFSSKVLMKKKCSEDTQTLRAGCSKAQPKNFAPPQTPFPGARDGQNLISWRWSLPSPTEPVWWRSMHAIPQYLWLCSPI